MKKNSKAIPFQPHPIDPDVKFKVGELVWAKMRGFPPWPAIVAQLSEQVSSNESEDASSHLKEEGCKVRPHKRGQKEEESSSISKQKLKAENVFPSCIIREKIIKKERSGWRERAPSIPLKMEKLSPQKVSSSYNRLQGFITCEIQTISSVRDLQVRKLLFEEEEKITVNFIGENTHATISVSRVQKWADYYHLYSKNRRVRLQPAIKEALRILRNEITYEGRQEISKLRACGVEQKKTGRRGCCSRCSLDYFRPRTRRAGQPKVQEEILQTEEQRRGTKLLLQEEGNRREKKNTLDVSKREVRNLQPQEKKQEEETKRGRERSRNREQEEEQLELSGTQESLQNFMELDQATNFTFIEPIVETLQRLETKTLTVWLLEDTKIGMTVQKLYKHCNALKQDYSSNPDLYSEKYEKIRGLALQILCRWRFVVEKCLFQGQSIDDKLMLKSNCQKPEQDIRSKKREKPPSPPLDNSRFQPHNGSAFLHCPRPQYPDYQPREMPPPRTWRGMVTQAPLGLEHQYQLDMRSSIFRQRNEGGCFPRMQAPPPLLGATSSSLDPYYK